MGLYRSVMARFCCGLLATTVALSLQLAASGPLQVPPQTSAELNGRKGQVIQGTGYSRDAYVTLVYGDQHIGARVLGQSLLESDTVKDRVALCTEAVSEKSKEVLKVDGWIVKSIHNIPNPYTDHSSLEYSSVYSKLHTWNMTEYERIVFLDSDTLVIKNIDHLFDCGTFCAAMRHSDLFNSGIMVIEPSAAVFQDMLVKAPWFPSYDGGDQGFLNEYFKDHIFAPFFNVSDSRRQHQPMRLPSGFNANVGQYYILSKWLIPRDEMWIIHLSVGPLRPWVWWQYRVFDQNWKWMDVRRRLSTSHDHSDSSLCFVFSPIAWAPYLLASLILLVFKYFSHWLNSDWKIRYFAAFNKRFSHYTPLPILCLSYYLVIAYILPTTMLPSHAEYVFWLWTSLFLLLFIGTYCCLCYATSKILWDAPTQKFCRKLLQTFNFFVVFTISHFVQMFVPLIIEDFATRMKVFLLTMVLHLAIVQVVGQALIRVWSCTPLHRIAKDKEKSISLEQR